MGNTEWITKLDGNKEIKRYLGGTIITLKLNSSDQLTGKDTHYQYHDHLGSIDVITDHQGNVVQELSFDAWGERRDAINWTNLNTTELVNFDSSITTRGFTGHEMLDEVGVIHMNGRIYDPKIARFLQADPFVQDPMATQSLNRYSYVLNNPLNATDPSGYFVFTLAAIALAAAEVVTGIYIIVAFGVAGLLDALAQGASFGDALVAGVSAAALSAIGGSLSPGAGNFGFNPATFRYVAAMSVASGVTSVVQGGKFGHGFASAGLGAIAGGALKIDNLKSVGAKAAASAIVGGTVSELSGGKFSNGAISGAFSQLSADFGEGLKSNPQESISFEAPTVEFDIPETSIELSDASLENLDLISEFLDENPFGPSAPQSLGLDAGLRDLSWELSSPAEDLAKLPTAVLTTDIDIGYPSGGMGRGELAKMPFSLSDWGNDLQMGVVGTMGVMVAAPILIGEAPVLVPAAVRGYKGLSRQAKLEVQAMALELVIELAAPNGKLDGPRNRVRGGVIPRRTPRVLIK